MDKSMSFLRKIFRKSTAEEQNQDNSEGQSSERLLEQTNAGDATADVISVVPQPSNSGVAVPPSCLLKDAMSLQDLNNGQTNELQRDLSMSQMTRSQFNNTCMDIVEWVSEAVTNIILPALADVLDANEEFHKIAKTVVMEVISRATTEVSPYVSKPHNGFRDDASWFDKQEDIHSHVDRAASDIVEIVLKELHNFSKTVQELDASDNKSVSLSPSQASSTLPLLPSSPSPSKGLSAAFGMFKSVASKLREFFIQHPPLLVRSEEKTFSEKDETSASIGPKYTFVTSVGSQTDQVLLDTCPAEVENGISTPLLLADSLDSCSSLTEIKSEVSLDSEILADVSLNDLTTCSDVSSLDRLDQPRLTPQDDIINPKAAWCTPSPESQPLIKLSEDKCLRIAIELVTEAVLRTAEDIAGSPDLAVSHNSGISGIALQSQNEGLYGDKKKCKKRMRFKRSFMKPELIFKRNKINPYVGDEGSKTRKSATSEQVTEGAHPSESDSAFHASREKCQKRSIFRKTLSAISQARTKCTDLFQAKDG